jgi:hypothetical protein
MTIEEYQILNHKYNQLNNEGLGYAVGEDNDNINEIDDIGELIIPCESDMDIAIYDNGNKYILVGNANGLWAIDVEK